VPSSDFYFPEQDLKHRERYEESDTHTTCGWKGESLVSIASAQRPRADEPSSYDNRILGEASYYNYKKPDGTVLKDIAW